jgi:hypothetical protein
MSVGFLLEFVNNTSSVITFSATVGSGGDWDSKTQARPDVDLKGLVLGSHSSKVFHEERANYIASTPFTVTAAFGGGPSIRFGLDGCDSENLAHDGEVAIAGGSADYAVYQMTSHATEVGGNYTKMTIFITPRVSPQRWMERLIAKNPALRLQDITLPGTHESGTAGGNGEMGTRCQTLTIKQQLAAGIRFFDLRVRPYTDDLGIFHAKYTQNLWLGKNVLPDVSQFLVDNPNECVVLLFNRAVDGDPAYDQLLHDLLCGNPAKNILPGVATNKLYDRDDATSLKLSDLKGCVVLMRRDPEASFGLRMWGLKDDNADDPITVGGAAMRVQDAYEYAQSAGSYIAGAKWPNVKKMLDAAKTDSGTWFVNFTSASHTPPTLGGYPLDVSSGSWGVNSQLARYLVTNPPFRGRLGTILMDGPEDPGNAMVVNLLIAMNERL